jgi:tetratricopeptide (TPR) repeat protein
MGKRIIAGIILMLLVFFDSFLAETKNEPTPLSQKEADRAKEALSEGVAYAKEQRYDEAIAHYSTAIKIKPTDFSAYHNRGLSYGKKGDQELAIADFTKTIELNPGFSDAYRSWGVSFTLKGDFDKAISDFTKAIELKPDYAQAYSGRGYASAKKGKLLQAFEDFQKAIELNPNLVEAYNNRAVFEFLGQDYDKAWNDVHKVEALGGAVNPTFLEALKKFSGREK